MKIIKQGKKPNKEVKFTCNECGCEFIAEEGEFDISHIGHDYIEYACASCPNCGTHCYKCE